MKIALLLGATTILAIANNSCTNSNDVKELEKSLKELEKKSEEVNYVEQSNDSVDFYMILPEYLAATTGLDEGQPYQYMNAVKEQYLVASYENIAEVKPLLNVMNYEGDTFLDKYTSFKKEIVNEGIAISKQESVKKLTINGLPARTMQFDGTVEGIIQPISYFAAIIEGKENIYFVILWTLESRKEEFKDIADKIIKSFRVKKK